MDKLLLIYNKGSFANSLIIELEKKFKIVQYCIHNGFDLNYYFEDIKNKVSNDTKYILYVSGETRDEKKMELLNYELPKNIIEFSINKNIRFIYLSSLAVFVNNYDTVVNINSERIPADKYGHTKNHLDLFVKGLNNDNINIIYPASFYSGNGRSSIEKITKIFLKYPLIFKFFVFPGSMSYIKREKLIIIIIETIKSNKKEIIASEELLLADLWKALYPNQRFYLNIPRLSVKILRILNKFLPAKIVIKLKMLLIGVKYE